jgi:hypothetical protein
MDSDSSREADNLTVPCEISYFIEKPKILYRVHACCILFQLNPAITTIPPCSEVMYKHFVFSAMSSRQNV